MSRHLMRVAFLALAVAGAPVALFGADLPASNLAGIDKVYERIGVTLNLEGADEFGIDPQKIIAIFSEALNRAGVSIDGTGAGLPLLSVEISGAATGGGGARFSVEAVIRVTGLPSPYVQNRSIEAIIWRKSLSNEELNRFDPIANQLVEPPAPLQSRVYDIARQVALTLESDFRRARQPN